MMLFTNKNVFKSFAVLFLSAFIGIVGVSAQDNVDSQKKRARGQEAINKLAERLPTVAVRYGKSAKNLRRLFLEDRTLFVDEADNLFYVDDPVEETQNYDSAAPTVEAAAPYAYDQTFKLHSRPGSSRVIYLDFDGHVTSNTQWNTSYSSGAPITSAPFSIDGDSATFNAQEQDAIQYIWQRVAEDYAAFDVDVTTEDPGDAAIYRATSSDLQYGTRAVISPTNFTGSSIGGVAYVGVFNYVGTRYQPAFVMSSGLGNNEKNIAEAASHEVGHNFGLSHDGKTNADGTTTGYYQGQGDWAPIMGVGYYKPVSQWSKGEYAGANQLQDDLAVIQNYGLPINTDDHSNTVSSATVLSGTNVSASGIITTRSDVDVFQFSTGAGSVTFNLSPAPRGGNLDILAQITDAQGNILAEANPAGLASSLTANLAAGVYYLKIDGVGAGDAATTGYSDYASIGQYSFNGALTASGNQTPTATATANVTSGTTPLTVQFSSVNSNDADGTIVSYAWNFGDGTNSTEPNPVHVYNSAGNFTATLTVTDNSGLIGTSSVVISATAPANQAPTAVASASTTNGFAPLAINFTGSNSTDADGTIASYAWNFGNGATANVANPSYTYSTAGNYTATLTVSDNRGATASSSIAITVRAAPAIDIFVGSIAMSTTIANRSASGRAVITVRDANGAVRPNVTVTARWSGLASDTETGTTNASGQIVFNSDVSKKRGTFTITVTNLAANGYTYNASRNVETSDSTVY